ncbi:MAG: amidohydrolase family protein [Armatimonadota bacterium]|nr:amidohydrolase family protein [Armatimonadota bacterium]
MFVDVHTHIYPRAYVDRLRRQAGLPRVEESGGKEYFVIFPVEERKGRAAGASPGRPIDTSYTSIEAKLDWMARHRIVHAVVSLGNPWYDFLPADEAPVFARQINDILLGYSRAFPDRISCLCALPVQDLDAALAELDRVLEAGARGIILSTRPAGLRLDDRRLWPLLGRLHTSRCPVLLHPHATVGGDDLEGYDHGLPLVFGFPFETSVAVARLILSGALDTFPGLTFIAAHAGGTLPYLAGRLDVWYASVGGGWLRSRPGTYLGHLYYDVLTYSAPAVRCALDTAGAGRLMFGSDHPFGIADVDAVRASLDAQSLDEVDRQRIAMGNAVDLFRLQDRIPAAGR